MMDMNISDEDTDDRTLVDDSNQPDYSAVDPPSNSPPSYSYVERRAELLQLIQQAGHPSVLNQTELADRYDVSQQQISKDFDRLQEYIRENLGERRDLVTLSVYDRAIRDLFEESKPYKAAQVASMREEYLASRNGTGR